MMEFWSIKKCIAIRKLLHISASKVGERVYISRQMMSIIESGKVNSDDALKRYEILYTLALKDILEERGTSVEKLKEQVMASIEDL